jgi:hypothetical protein
MVMIANLTAAGSNRLVHLQEAARQGIGVATRQRHHETADRSR